MATIVLENGVLVVRFSDGTSRSSGVRVTSGMSEADIRNAIGQARTSVVGYYDGAGNDAKSREASRANGNAGAMYRQLHPEARQQEEQPAERRAPQQEPQRRETQRAQPPPRQEPQRREPAARPPPRPRVTQEWLEAQLREARRDDRRAQAAATALYANRNFVNQFLSPDAQRGTSRTDAQKNATIAAFNALYQIPAFRLYLSSLAAMRRDPSQEEVHALRLPQGATMPLYPDYVTLQTFLTEPGRPESLGEQASAEIIRAADAYVRHFLLIFAARDQRNARFSQEIGQMNIGSNVADLGWRLRNAQGAMTFQPASGRGPTDADRAALAQLYISGPMDSDTLVASVLFLRRWALENPERGRGRSQEQISIWQVPQIIPLEQAAPQPQQVVQPPPQVAQPAQQAAQVPRIAVIGDSILAGGRMGGTLQTTLRRQFQGAQVDTFAHGGDQLPAILNQLNTSVVNARPPYNAIVVDGGINDFAGTRSVEDAERVYTRIITAARQSGAKVILIGLTPWAGASASRGTSQTRTSELNTWLRGQAQADGSVVFVDVSVLGEGNPPRLRRQFDSGDGLHPTDSGRDQMAALVAQGVYGVAQTTDQRTRALQDFANQYWSNLASELYRLVSGSQTQAQSAPPPEGVISIMRNKPQGTASVEEALRTLGRDDIQRAYDRVFNDLMSQDADFLEFCRGRREYQGIARTGVRLSQSTDVPNRRLVVRAMQDYLNWETGRSGQEWYARLRDDLSLLYRQVLQTNRDNILADGQEDMRTLTALSVYSWRKAHQTDAVGAWGPNLNLRVEQPQQQQVQPPPPPPPRQEQRREERGRTIIP